MLLTISTTRPPATDLGYLLGKHPDRAQALELPFGTGHVFYPEADAERCTAALLLEIDPVALVRRRDPDAGFALAQYVSDRPYAASSLLAVAIGRVFGSALAGRCSARPELAEAALPLVATIAALPVRGRPELLRELFEPLGYAISAQAHPLDTLDTLDTIGAPASAASTPYHTVTLRGELPLARLLTHLCVLIPVLDDDKHYFVGDDEVEKLLRRGDGWLSEHPRRELIVHRYLKRQRSLTRAALRRLADDAAADDAEQARDADAVADAEEAALERPASLQEQRLDAVVETLRLLEVKTVADVGCGEGALLRRLTREPSIERLLGVDVSMRALERARARLGLEPPILLGNDMADGTSRRGRGPSARLLHGSILYRDQRLQGLDAICLVEVIEHVDKPRLRALERALFEFARPTHVVLTTPNAEYNVRYPHLPAGATRHRDHRFEWTRSQFETWARKVAERHGYVVEFSEIGPSDEELGAPTQMAVFHR
ncbi:MAG: 3' terminal RNA ribose 2'-O-methyltransferase Hen1 [Myxococcales bacterium]|nr:3' terminal RNA ribose 2'-O-methyltransferase Hen1 [Myxococcales bacterium]